MMGRLKSDQGQADASQYQPVNRPKWTSLGIGTPQHIDLLPQHHNLCLERCARP